MYAGDTFFTLSTAGQAGLAALSALLALATAAVAAALLSRLWKSPVLRLTVALVVFYGFLWLSPQIYYFYYLVIFDGLPWQIVVGAPPDPVLVIDLLLFQGTATLADHAKGIFGWLLLGLATWRRRFTE